MPAYEMGRWDLGDLFHGFDDPELARARARVEERVGAFEGYRPRLDASPTAALFQETLRAYAEIQADILRLTGFTFL